MRYIYLDEEKQFVIHPVTTATVDSTLLCVDNIGKKRLTDKTFIPKKCDDIKWKLFDSFFFCCFNNQKNFKN